MKDSIINPRKNFFSSLSIFPFKTRERYQIGNLGLFSLLQFLVFFHLNVCILIEKIDKM